MSDRFEKWYAIRRNGLSPSDMASHQMSKYWQRQAYDACQADINDRLRSEEVRDIIARVVVDEHKRQFSGHQISGVPEAVDSWTATGGVFDCSDCATAILNKLVEMVK